MLAYLIFSIPADVGTGSLAAISELFDVFLSVVVVLLRSEFNDEKNKTQLFTRESSID